MIHGEANKKRVSLSEVGKIKKKKKQRMRESSCAAIQRQEANLLRHNRKSIGISVLAFSKAWCVCCVASVSVTLLSRAGDPPPWRLIHFDEADCADAQRPTSPLFLAKR